MGKNTLQEMDVLVCLWQSKLVVAQIFTLRPELQLIVEQQLVLSVSIIITASLETLVHVLLELPG